GEVLELVVPEYGREGHGRASAAQVPSHDSRSASVALGALELDAKGRKLCGGAQERAIAVSIDDGVADDVRANRVETLQRLVEIREGDAFGIHDTDELLDRDLRRLELDQLRRRVHHVAGSKDDLAPVGFERPHLLLRS